MCQDLKCGSTISGLKCGLTIYTVSVLNLIICELQLLNPLLTILENSAIILIIEIMSISSSLFYAYSQYIIHSIISYDL